MEAKEIADQVFTSIDEITLPTYELLGENRNPVFHSQYGVAHIYPYSLQDQFSTEPTEITYRTLVLENRYLRITVLPQLGGRVFSVFDKISDREVFYKNPTIKFSPLAIRGAFFSGGVEFSFPVAHSPTTVESVNWDFQQGEDGSASIVIGGIEHISGLRWTIILTLFPDRCALAQDVQLSNPTPIPGRYHYWTNASTHSDHQTEFIYPLQRVRSYEFAGTTSWPIARLDSVLNEPGLPGMEGVPMWPAERMHAPVNFRWEKNMLAQVSIFGRNVNWNFFGSWQHSSDTGYAHYANHQDVSGMKLWSWGQSEVGIVNQTALMDDGALYAETQCGAMETQLDFDFLQPGTTRKWREWWLPLRDLGGLTCASEEMGARIQLTPSVDESKVKLDISICPATPIPAADILLSTPGEIILQEEASISPHKTWQKEIFIDAIQLSDHPLTLIVKDAQGKELLTYTHDTSPNKDSFIKSETFSPPVTADDFYQLGLKHENFDDRAQALDSYRKAILISEEHGPSHFQLGLMLLRSADIDAATHHFRWAADLGINSANYYLGLIAWYKDDSAAAEKLFQSIAADDPLAPATLYRRVAIAFKNADWKNAIELIRNFTSGNNVHPVIQLLLGITNLHLGNSEKGQEEIEGFLEFDPLNLLALKELSNLESGNTVVVTDKLNRLLADDEQYVLDLACFYLDLGLREDASKVLKNSESDWQYAPRDYLLAYLHESDHESASWRARAQDLKPDYVFPSRLWEILAIQDALEADPDNYQAKYFLGNFYYSRQRYDEAVQLWEEALVGLATYDVLYRNLGLAYWQQGGDLTKATQFFETALGINPGNQDLYIHLDDLYKEQADNQKRADLLTKIEQVHPLREDLRKRKIAILIDLDQHEMALKIMSSEEFVPLEMDQTFHNVYVRALLKNAEMHIDSRQFDQAIADYRKALEFPKNHGVGKPVTLTNAEILYYLGCAYEKMGKYPEAIQTWREAAQEHHKFGEDQFQFLQMSLDKLGRYSELGYEG